MFTDLEIAAMIGGHSVEPAKPVSFIKELHEARLIRTRDDLRSTYKEICENLYLMILALDFLSNLKKGSALAKNYAGKTASYINYTEFRTNATDLYNHIYFAQERPEIVEKLFQSKEARELRQRTQVPLMELNRWLMKIDDPTYKDAYFLMRLEQALNISSSELKEIRRLLSYRNPSDSDLSSAAHRILNSFRSRMPMSDFKSELESILSGQKLDYIR